MNYISAETIIASSFEEHLNLVNDIRALIPEISKIAELFSGCLQRGGKILWMGNGGSAADAQHLAAELIGRFTRERRALPSIALTTDTSILTALANDYSFEQIFARQIEGLCSTNDVVVGISTSGNSPNVLAGIKMARTKGAKTVAFSGGANGGQLKELADICIHIKSSTTARIQETHILIGHILCDLTEAATIEDHEQ